MKEKNGMSDRPIQRLRRIWENKHVIYERIWKLSARVPLQKLIAKDHSLPFSWGFLHQSSKVKEFLYSRSIFEIIHTLVLRKKKSVERLWKLWTICFSKFKDDWDSGQSYERLVNPDVSFPTLRLCGGAHDLLSQQN